MFQRNIISRVKGPEHQVVTFSGFKRKQIAQYGEYLTQRLVLTTYDACAADRFK